MQYVAPIVESMKSELSAGARRRLVHALALAASGWAARALVRQALAEARERAAKR